MKPPYPLTLMVLGTAALIATPFQSAQALSTREVSAIAEAVTVRIEGQNPGSGVIIKRQGDVYTVLTAAHVVATADEHDLVTADNQQHPFTYNQVQKFSGVDLALVEFTSSKAYQVAEMGDSTEIKAGELVYVSGFPMPTIAITESIWTFSKGEVTANAKRPLADGYALVYSNNTLPGMSGGAVLDSQGKLIGIHGRADAEQHEQRTETVYVKTGFNLGIPINTFLSLVATANPQLGFTRKATLPTGSALTADDWYLQGTDKFRKGDYWGAIADLGKAIQLNPDYADAYNNRGVAYYALKEYSKALSNYDQAISIDSSFANAYSNRGNTYDELKEYPKALSNYDQAIALDPNHAHAYNNRATTYEKLEQYPQAIAGFDKAIALVPSDAKAYYNRGNIYLKLDKYVEARANYDQAIALDSDLAEAYYNRGLSYALTKNTAQAKQNLQTAASLFQQQNRLEEHEKAMQLLKQL